MKLQAVLPKTLLLIMCFITLENEAFGNPIALSLEAGNLILSSLFGNTESEIKYSFTNLVTLAKIPHEDDKKVSGLTIKGTVPSDVSRFIVDLIDTSGNIGLHISLRFPEKKTVFNSYEKERRVVTDVYLGLTKTFGGWGKEEVYEELEIKPGNEFEIIIEMITDEKLFEIQINDEMFYTRFYTFDFRTPIENLIFLRIERDVTINSVTWNYPTHY